VFVSDKSVQDCYREAAYNMIYFSNNFDHTLSCFLLKQKSKEQFFIVIFAWIFYVLASIPMLTFNCSLKNILLLFLLLKIRNKKTKESVWKTNFNHIEDIQYSFQFPIHRYLLWV